MKILIVTQKVDKDDSVLGFFHGWLKEFAKHCEKVTVICLFRGAVDLPKNVTVCSLGKEDGVFFYSKCKYVFRFLRYICGLRRDYETVFVHMNQIYVILGWLIWRMFGKKIGLWYVHRQTSFSLYLAEKLADIIFTASAESFRISSKKVAVLGHGIDTEIFSPVLADKFSNARTAKREIVIISVGRISPTKNQMVLLETANVMLKKALDFKMFFIGGPITDHDKKYFEEIKKKAREYGLLDTRVFLTGPLPPGEAVIWYKKADIFVNLSNTGSLDKAVLEAMSTGLHVLTSNEAFKDILPDANLTTKNPLKIAEKIEILSKTEISDKLRNFVVQNHNLINLIPKIIDSFKIL